MSESRDRVAVALLIGIGSAVGLFFGSSMTCTGLFVGWHVLAVGLVLFASGLVGGVSGLVWAFLSSDP